MLHARDRKVEWDDVVQAMTTLTELGEDLNKAVVALCQDSIDMPDEEMPEQYQRWLIHMQRDDSEIDKSGPIVLVTLWKVDAHGVDFPARIALYLNEKRIRIDYQYHADLFVRCMKNLWQRNMAGDPALQEVASG